MNIRFTEKIAIKEHITYIDDVIHQERRYGEYL